jgi:hypothetical protein
MADQVQHENEAAKQQLTEERKVSDKTRADFIERTKGKPTPTQEENDLAVLGAHFHEHEPDGSELDPNVAMNRKNLEPESKKPGSPAEYKTRQAQPATTPSKPT